MAVSSRKIKKQIQSIGNIKKITKAMELVSTAKMQKAVNAVLASRPYAQLAWQIVLNIAGRVDTKLHPLLQINDVKKIGVVVLSSNRGLCGVFNQQIFKKALSYLSDELKNNDDAVFEFITLGRKGAQLIANSGNKIIADFEKTDIITSFEQIKPVSKMIMADYLAGRYDKVMLVYTDFISSLKQKPQIKQLLPITPEWQVGLGEVGSKTKPSVEIDTTWQYSYLFEPGTSLVLEMFLPKLLEIQIYQAMLESNASEHSARMLAMRNASDAAIDLISDLTLAFNKVRQSGITQELSEITNSKIALENQ